MPIPDLGKLAKSLSLLTNKPQILFRVPKVPDVPDVPDGKDGDDGIPVPATFVATSFSVDKDTRRRFQSVPDIAENVLQPFANMTLIRPDLIQREECREHPRRLPPSERGRGEEGWGGEGRDLLTPREQRRPGFQIGPEPEPWVMPTAPQSWPTPSWPAPIAPVHGGSHPPTGPPPAWVESVLAAHGVPEPLLDPDPRHWPSSPPVPFAILPPPAEAGPSLELAAVRSSTEEATAGPSSGEAASGSSPQPAAAMSSSQLAAAWSSLEIAADGPSSEDAPSFQPAPASPGTP